MLRFLSLCVVFTTFSFLSWAEEVDYILKGDYVVTLAKDKPYIENGAVAVKAEKIVAVGTQVDISKKYTAKTVLEGKNKIITPGLINAHTHAPMVLFRGLSDDKELMEWLQKSIWPAEKEFVNKDFIRYGMQQACLEMIVSGTTTFADMYFFPHVSAQTVKDIGMRAIITKALLDFPMPDDPDWPSMMKTARGFLAKWKNDPLITPGLGPHAPYTVSPEHLKETKALSDEFQAPILIHVAETKFEPGIIKNNYKQDFPSPVQYLESLGFLSNKVTAAHVVWTDETDRQLMKKRGVGMAHCPSSNFKLASGFAAIPEMLKLHIRLGLGADGAASNNDLMMWEEIDSVAKMHKAHRLDPKVVTAQEAFTMATLGGARALHMEESIGSLEVGKKADIIAVSLTGYHQFPVYNPFSTLVYTTKSHDVDMVMVHGKLLMKPGRVLNVNIDQKKLRKEIMALRDKMSKYAG